MRKWEFEMSHELEDMQQIIAAGYDLVIEDLSNAVVNRVGVMLVPPNLCCGGLEVFKASTIPDALQRARAWAMAFPHQVA